MFIQHLSFHRMPQNCIFLHVNSSLKHMISSASSDASSVKTPLSPSSPGIGIEASRSGGSWLHRSWVRTAFLLFSCLQTSLIARGSFSAGDFHQVALAGSDLALRSRMYRGARRGSRLWYQLPKILSTGIFFPSEWNKAKTTTIVGKLKRIVLPRLSVKLCFVMYLRETGWLKDFFLKVSGFMVFQFVGLGWLLFCWLQSASRFAHVRLRICYPWEHQTMWRHRSLIKLYFIF